MAAARQAGKRTRWVAGASASTGMPLAALADLLEVPDGAHSDLALVDRAVRAVASGQHGEFVFVIDDAHLLDEVSVAFINGAALTGAVPFVMTVRSGAVVPDPIRALWKDGVLGWLGLSPLSRTRLRGLVRAVLGGVVDSRTCERLCVSSGGNLVFLRELVDGGLEDGRLRIRDCVWRWDGAVSPSARLADIVRAEMGALNTGERAALELLALSQPAELIGITRLVSPDTVTDLERRGLLTVEGHGRNAQVRLAHPLYTEVVRQEAPEAAAVGLRRRLADDLAPWPPFSPRLGSLLLDSDGPPPPAGLLADAALAANAECAYDLSERLARAAVDSPPDGASVVRAGTALIEALHWQGRAGEAERMAATLAAGSGRDILTPQFALARAMNLFFGLGRAAEADAQLRAAEAAVSEHEDRGVLHAARGVLAFFNGRPHEAVAAAQDVLADAPGPSARAWACAAAAAGHAITGRTAAGLAAAASGDAALDGTTIPGAPFLRLVLSIAETLALLLSGQVSLAATRSAQVFEDVLRRPASACDAVATLHVGWAALTAGRLRTAVRWLTETSAGLRRSDPLGLQQLCSALLAQGHALAGDHGVAGELLAGRDTAADQLGAVRVFEPEVRLAEALASAGSAPSLAMEWAQRGAQAAAAMGQWPVEARALHVTAGLGNAGLGNPGMGSAGLGNAGLGSAGLGSAGLVADRLVHLATLADGPLVRAFAAHAEAVADRAGGRLDKVADDFEAMGAILYAAEATAQAAAAHERAGDRQRRAASAVRAVRLAGDCGVAAAPVLGKLPLPVLTSREDEVARLAAAGLSNRAIADRLVVSVHTVETHLARSYAKLGIGRRKELRAALQPAREVPGQRPATGNATSAMAC
jgi:DNA-binding CsgD family transcriptional regulator